MTTNTSPFYTERSIPVRTYDIDALGHVSNIVYVRWLEDIRLALLEDYLPLEKLMEQNIAPVLIKTEIEYRKPVELHDSVVGRCWVTNIGAAKAEISFEIVSNGEIRATARQTGIFFDLEKQKPVRVPKEFMKQWNDGK